MTSVDDAALAIRRLYEIDRLTCRRVFDERFDIKRTTREYVALYKQLQQAACRPLVADVASSRLHAELGRDGAA